MTLMVKAMQAKVGNPLRKLVLIKLADNANDQGECWPSYQHIADQCEISKRSVIAHIDALVKVGFLQKEHRIGEKGNKSNLYFVRLPSAGNSLGVVQEIHPPSENAALPSAGDSPPPSAGAAPRISHSLEPVNEPVIEPKDKREKFIAPSVFDVHRYMQTIGKGSYCEAEKFVDFYESKGWLVGKSKMKNWQASVRNWTKNSVGQSIRKQTGFTVEQARPQIIGFLND